MLCQEQQGLSQTLLLLKNKIATKGHKNKTNDISLNLKLFLGDLF